MILRKLTTNFLVNRQVVLVDEHDQELGVADIYEAHKEEGKKHRALSVILYRKAKGKTEILMQRRAATKPVFKDLWSNTCCTNLRPGDTYLQRAVSRLGEEMGIELEEAQLRIIYSFSYAADDFTNPGWCENELDTVIVGEWDGRMRLNPEEASEAKWMGYEEMKEDMEKNPRFYSPWHKMIINDPRFVEEVI